MFNGLGMNLGNLSRLSNAKSRSISPEKLHGRKKGARRYGDRRYRKGNGARPRHRLENFTQYHHRSRRNGNNRQHCWQRRNTAYLDDADRHMAAYDSADLLGRV